VSAGSITPASSSSSSASSTFAAMTMLLVTRSRRNPVCAPHWGAPRPYAKAA
jgi:hypothetical protein